MEKRTLSNKRAGLSDDREQSEEEEPVIYVGISDGIASWCALTNIWDSGDTSLIIV